jgi:hypothetical protein
VPRNNRFAVIREWRMEGRYGPARALSQSAAAGGAERVRHFPDEPYVSAKAEAGEDERGRKQRGWQSTTWAPLSPRADSRPNLRPRRENRWRRCPPTGGSTPQASRVSSNPPTESRSSQRLGPPPTIDCQVSARCRRPCEHGPNGRGPPLASSVSGSYVFAVQCLRNRAQCLSLRALRDYAVNHRVR